MKIEPGLHRIGDDVIEASWEALTDSYVYGLMKLGVEPRL